MANPLTHHYNEKVTLSRRPTLVVGRGQASSSGFQALEKLDCSSIAGSRSSSFLSEVGRARIMEDLQLENRNTLNERPLQMRKRRGAGAFPSDFFNMR